MKEEHRQAIEKAYCGLRKTLSLLQTAESADPLNIHSHPIRGPNGDVLIDRSTLNDLIIMAREQAGEAFEYLGAVAIELKNTEGGET